ncbi:hypothetical protein [Pleionea sediminis]|uniref:hypothetical protein n=1 Tax=Pleionea sediminis TaxID=2569479 RepID=UPI001186BFBB|nr:hypothetical protein [Pleionea sediminis]
MNTKNIVSYIEIDGPAKQTNHAVEVYVTLTNDERRWCFFHSPETVKNCGDYIDGTNIRMHYGEKHMFVLSEVTQDSIRKTIKQLDEAGKILECTVSI